MIIITLSIILLTSIAIIIYLKANKSQTPSIKGYKSTNKDIGNLADAGSLHELLVKGHKEFGPIFSFWWMKEQVVSIGTGQYFKTINSLFDRPISLFSLFMPLIGNESIQYQNGETGKGRRNRYIKPALTREHIDSNYFDILKNTFQTYQKHIENAVTEQKALNIADISFEMAIYSIVQIAFGGALEEEQIKVIAQNYHSCWHEMETRMSGSFPAEGDGRQEKFDESLKFMHDFALQTIKKGGSSEFINKLKAENNQQQIKDEVVTMFVGGFHTTGNLIIWTLYFLSKNQDKQQQLFEEINQFWKDGEELNHNIITKLQYCNKVIKESLRLSILAPWGARYSEKDVVFPNGEIVKKNTPVIISFGNTLQDPKFWGDNSEEFVPERFDKPLTDGYQYMPFGFAGARPCPGKALAEVEVSIFVAYIVKNYIMELAHPEKPVEKVYQLVTSPSSPIEIKFSRR